MTAFQLIIRHMPLLVSHASKYIFIGENKSKNTQQTQYTKVFPKLPVKEK